MQRAIPLVSAAIQLAQSHELSGQTGAARLLAEAWLLKANALRETNTADARAKALNAYTEARHCFEAVMQPDDPEDVNQLANIWTNRGMTLLDDGGAVPLAEALACFERAIDLRARLPLETNPLFIWGLGAAWMNRADALTRLGQPAQLAYALDCYAEAIALLQRMPLDAHPTYRARLALAWMNRGLTAQAQGMPESTQEALCCYTQSIGLLPSGHVPVHPEQRRVLCCAHLNRGHALLNAQPAQPDPAREAAFAALGLAAEFERAELLAAQIGLQSRHLLCRAIAHLLDLAGDVPGDWITETTDAVDDGMALAQHWRQRGESCLRVLETDLFRFGALIYRLCQPHFLAEFLLDSLDPARSVGALVADEAMHHIATDALWCAIVDLNLQRQAAPSETHQSNLLARLETLQQAETRLTELRLEHLCAAPRATVS